MKQRFTKLLAAFALLVFMMPSLAGWGQNSQSVTIPMNKQGWSDAQAIESGTLKDANGVSTSFNYTSDQGEASTPPTYYNTGTNVRFYCKKNGTGNGGSMTITPVAESGITITGIELTATSGYAKTTKYNVDGGSDATLTWNGTTGIVSDIEATTSFKFRNANQANNTDQLRITQIVITYTTTGGDTPSHSLSFGASPAAGGSVTAGSLTSPASVVEGAVINITATANTGYVFTSWSVTGTGSSVASSSSASTTFTMGTADATLTANFTQVPQYIVTYHANVDGVDDVVVSYNQGATVTVAGNTFSNPGYAFIKWTTNADGTGTEYQPGATISNIQANIDLYAQWEVTNDVTYSFAFTEIGTTGWTNGYLDHDYTYTDGTTAYFYQSSKQTGTITDIPVTKEGPICIVMDDQEITGASFVCRQWGTKAQTITLWYSTDGGENYTSTGITSTNFTISSSNLPTGTNAVKITFSSTSNQVGIESATVTLAGSKHNIELASVQNGNISASPMQASEGQVVTLTATPDAGFVFGAWDVFKTGESSTKVTVTNNQFEMPDYDVTVSATFTTACTLTYSVNGVTSDEDYPLNGQITLPVPTQNIPEGFSFVGWTVDENDVQNLLASPYLVSAAATLYAVFSEVNSVTLTKDDVPASYAETEGEITVDNNSFGIFRVANYNNDYIQLQGNSDYHGYIYNKTTFSNLISIVATQTGTHRDVTLSAGNSENPTNGTIITPNIEGMVDTYMINGNYSYIVLTNTTSNALRYSSIVFVFDNPNAPRYTRVYTKDITGYNNSQYGYTLIASPIEGVNPANVAGMTDGNFDLYRFNESAELEWENWKQEGEHNHFNLERGKGYLYAHKTDVTLAFAGTPVQGTTFNVTLNKTTDAQYEGVNLVGNPFGQTAYIDRDFYVMNQAGSEFITSSGAIAPMQGIIVGAASHEETLTFTTEAPSNGGGSKVAINLTRNRGEVIDRAIVRFGEGSQLHKFQLRENSTKVYFTEGNQDFAVVRSQKAQGEMPVNFKAEENGTYTLSVNTEEMELNYLHLIDNMTGMDVDLLQTPSYTFDATTNDYTSRFRLVFSANNVDGPSTGSEAFAFYSNGNWVVNNEGEATLQVIDVNGRIVSNETINGTVATSINATPGVYMLRLVNGNEVKTQKIVVR